MNEVVSHALIARYRQGDQQVFDKIVAQATPLLRAYIRRIRGSSDGVEEILSVVYWRMYCYLPKFVGKNMTTNASAKFSSWAYRLCVNATIDYKRARTKATDYCQLEIHNENGEEFELGEIDHDAALSVPSAESEVLGRVDALIVRECVNRLPDYCRNVAIRTLLMGETPTQVSESLNIPFGTAKSRAFKARKILRERLEGLL